MNDDWDRLREIILRDSFTGEWFERETLEKLFHVKIHYATRSEFKYAFFHNLDDSSIIIGKEVLLETVPGDYTKAIPYTILTQSLLGTAYFSLRGKAFRDAVGPKIQSVLQTHIRIANGLVEVHNEKEYIDHLYVDAFGRGSPLIDDLKEVFEEMQEGYEESEEIFSTEILPMLPPPPVGQAHVKVKVDINLGDLMTKYEGSRSVAVTHFYTQERASREGPESVWRLANELMDNQSSGIDLSPYFRVWETYGPDKNFIGRVEDFRLGEDTPESYTIPVT